VDTLNRRGLENLGATSLLQILQHTVHHQIPRLAADHKTEEVNTQYT
jgi:hypothetical protein